ncbi:MAG TPA: hypothetical protein PKH77_13475 [Anaerolineae bacterium]|nr:hypothetical protein [Anaerolineae bacterium]
MATVLRDYIDAIKSAATDAGLSVAVMLGYPEEGRPLPTLPIFACRFQRDDFYRDGAARTIGRTVPAGVQIDAILSVFTENEYQLLQMVDFLRTARTSITSLTVGTDIFVLTYGATNRMEIGQSDIQNHAAEINVTFVARMK